ncbi:MAG: crossover junction endodeoxyribonuclease RuvC [Rhodospirillaceae bacterium]|nr:crossover junction endodeoxyribonuclease RuvC [Rhodospirillaceae bacterium]
MRILGLDPGLRRTGWGVIDHNRSSIIHVGNGTVQPSTKLTLVERLVELHRGVLDVVKKFQPDSAAAEETFVNKNPSSTLKLGIARGAVLISPALANVAVTEYAPNRVKKSVVGVGHASKEQIQLMVRKILPSANIDSPDSADALAVAICHAHFSQVNQSLGKSIAAHETKEYGRAVSSRMQELIDAALCKETLE